MPVNDSVLACLILQHHIEPLTWLQEKAWLAVGAKDSKDLSGLSKDFQIALHDPQFGRRRCLG